MNTYLCNGCETEFQAEQTIPCPQCGGSDIDRIGDIDSQKLTEAHMENYQGEIRDILKELCLETYEKPYNSAGWDESINRTLDKLMPYLVTAQVRSKV